MEIPAVPQFVSRVRDETPRFARGVGTGVTEEVRAVSRDARVVGSLLRDHGAREGVRLLREGMREMDSGSLRDTLAETFVRPIVRDFQAGRHGEAVGRASFFLVATVLPGDKLLRAAAAVGAKSTG